MGVGSVNQMQLFVHKLLIRKTLLQICVKEVIIKISQEIQRTSTTLLSSVATELWFL
jgi:hypothetical protein